MSLPTSRWPWTRPHHLTSRFASPRPRLYVLLGLALVSLTIAACGTNEAPSSSLSGKLLLSGSTALQPLATEAAKRFEQEYPHVQVEVTGGGSLAGLSAVSNHQADIGNSDVYADPAVYPDPALTDHLVCVIPFVMIVNHDVSVTNLRKQDIIDIFSTGKITNWKQVGGDDLPIVPVVRPATSGTRATFRKYILAGRDENGTLLKTDSSQTVLDTVANTPGSIGYLAVPVVDDHVGIVAIDGQLPSLASIEHGSYAFWGFEHMYTLGDSSLSAAFLNFMLSPSVQQLAQQLHYIPIADMKLTQGTPSSPQALVAASETTREGTA
jgi:phosphate transport system substrate-binding protein